MIKNYFKIAWRNVWKHKFYTGINILGLALSIGCSVILFQFINYHLSFDTYHHDAKQLYKSVTELHLDDGSVDDEQGTWDLRGGVWDYSRDLLRVLFRV